ncbi:primary-amine oxidase [Acrasis kona]|uniref:Amine oxidase n=1 Tax=Acrasis kona TaxID=1008807 RepID=A0AAW2YTH7_9EUKA
MTSHPLDILRPEEVTLATGIVSQELTKHSLDLKNNLFISIDLIDPPKQAILNNDKNIDRKVIVVTLDTKTKIARESIVSLSTKKILKWSDKHGVHPLIPSEEFEACDRIVKKDPKFIEIMAKKGFTKPELWMIEPWTAGYYGDDSEKGQRLLKTLVFSRLHEEDHGYAHPIEGLSVVFDLANMKILKINDELPHIPTPMQTHNYQEHLWLKQDPKNKMRTNLKPIVITQPEGPSFQVDGNLVKWQNWSFRVQFTTREGLVLQNIHFHNRPIIYRASIAEMTVPYGDPTPVHSSKNVFDLGEYGMGRLTNSLNPNGCDCAGSINHYFDGVMCNSFGQPFVVPRAVCMHEEDDGIAWKHTDWRLQHADVRRNRKLSLSFMATVGNYEYGFFWHLSLDGNIELSVKHTGIVNTFAMDPNNKTLTDENGNHKFATRLNKEGLHAHVHQHIYCARLDMMIDGIKNSVVEVDVLPEMDRKINPRLSAFRPHFKTLKSEKQACRDINLETSRTWEIINPNIRNQVGSNVGYNFHPGSNVRAFAQHDSHLFKRASWLKHHLWVTPYHEEEMYPSGDYPNQSDGASGGPGIAEWIKKDRNVENVDVVLWYTFGITHVVRLEDWPVMPVGLLHGFRMIPSNFFKENPVLDVPASKEQARVNSEKCCNTKSKL